MLHQLPSRLPGRAKPPALSCDTFVITPEGTRGGYTLFGKNSDRPSGEVSTGGIMMP
jgi:hypothetical protein